MINVSALLGYKGKNVVVTGGENPVAQSMISLLIKLEANVFLIGRMQENVSKCRVVIGDLGTKAAIEEVVEKIPDKIYAVFLYHEMEFVSGCGRLMWVMNFYGKKYFIDCLKKHFLPNACIILWNSDRVNWQEHLADCAEILEVTDFEDALNWYDRKCSEFVKRDIDEYKFSKSCLNAYAYLQAAYGSDVLPNIRINVIVQKEADRNVRQKDIGYPIAFLGSRVFQHMSSQIIYL